MEGNLRPLKDPIKIMHKAFYTSICYLKKTKGFLFLFVQFIKLSAKKVLKMDFLVRSQRALKHTDGWTQ